MKATVSLIEGGFSIGEVEFEEDPKWGFEDLKECIESHIDNPEDGKHITIRFEETFSMNIEASVK